MDNEYEMIWFVQISDSMRTTMEYFTIDSAQINPETGLPDILLRKHRKVLYDNSHMFQSSTFTANTSSNKFPSLDVFTTSTADYLGNDTDIYRNIVSTDDMPKTSLSPWSINSFESSAVQVPRCLFHHETLWKGAVDVIMSLV